VYWAGSRAGAGHRRRVPAAQSARRVAYIDAEAAIYDSYVDIKLASPRYLARAVAHVDDPTRASFLDARIVFDHTVSMAAAVAGIVPLPDDFWQRRVHATKPDCTGYFLKQAHERNDRFLRQHSAVHLCFAVGRVALAVNRTLSRVKRTWPRPCPNSPTCRMASSRRGTECSLIRHRIAPTS
jgi:hypothetical protein